MSALRLGAVVVAAGAGRRLGGRNKAVLPIGKSTFLSRIVDGCRDIGVASIVVVVGPPFAQETGQLAARLRTEVVVNADSLRGGMSSSVALGFARMELLGVDASFLWPVDHPRVEKNTLRALLRHGAKNALVIPRFSERNGHPPLIGSEYFALLCASASYRGGAREALRCVPDPKFVDVLDGGVLRDVDVEADLP